MKKLLFRKTWNGMAFARFEIYETEKSYIVEKFTNVCGGECEKLMYKKTDEMTKYINGLIDGEIGYFWFREMFLDNQKPYRKKIDKVF